MVTMNARLKAMRYDAILVGLNLLLQLPGHRFRLAVLRAAGVQVGAEVAVERAVRISSLRGVRLGDNCNVNTRTYLDGRGGLELGDLVNVSPGVTFLTASHDVDSPTFEGKSRGVTVGSRAWIATNAIIMPGARIGEGAVVSAGAVVHGEVPPYTVVAGNPAKPIRERSREAQTELMTYRRWFH
jgi:acetyltransferase-like isoleucine patch superfamily enzyme